MDLEIDQYMKKAEDGEDYFTIAHLKTEDLVDLAGMMHLHASTLRDVVKWGLDEGASEWFFAEADKWEERERERAGCWLPATGGATAVRTKC
jgi:hypothetical protein